MESLSNKDRRNSGILRQKEKEFISYNINRHLLLSEEKSNQSLSQKHTPNDHVHFDEQIISEHDQERGTRTKIDEPKTPYEADYDENEEQQDQLIGKADVVMNDSEHSQPMDEDEVKKHLEEAEKNKMLNAQLQKEEQLRNLESNLANKLEQTKAEQDEEEQKHQEFLKKRKEHYKNEFNPAKLLQQKLPIDEEEEDQGQ